MRDLEAYARHLELCVRLERERKLLNETEDDGLAQRRGLELEELRGLRCAAQLHQQLQPLRE